jgi:hypothetical protein
MSEIQGQPTKPEAGAGRVPWWSTRTSRHLVEFAAQLLLELLPVEAVLIVVAGYGGQDITAEPIPFWFLLGTFLLASGLGRYLIGIRLKRLLVISSPLYVISALLLIRISPALYGSSGNGFFDWSWMYSFGSDFANQSPTVAALPALLLLLAYIWWRGLKLGCDPPDYSMVMRRFKYGMIAIVAVTIASIGVRPALQPHVVGVLGFLLPAEVFAGLVAAALGRMALNQVERRVDAYMRTNDRLWLGTALGLALAAIGFALVINLILNYQSVGSLLALLGPIGTMTNKLTTLLVNGLAQLLRFLFDWLFGLIHPITSRPSVREPATPPSKGKQKSHNAPPIPSQWLEIARIVLEVAALVLVIVLFLWLMRTIVTHRRPHEEVLDEERESLDATSIFRSQLRAFLAGLRPARAAAWVDPLVPGSVRYLYREFLESAYKRGMARNTSETPDEYSARLSKTRAMGGPEPQSGGDQQLEALNEAYNSTRYAERPPTGQEMPGIRRLVKSLERRLER